MEKRLFVGGNWKMNGSLHKLQEAATEMKTANISNTKVEVVIAPPAPYLMSAVAALKPFSVGVAAQNVHEEASGAFTGEQSVGMLLDVGAEWVIIGHSERRTYFMETDKTVCAKTAAALKNGLGVIFCCGEPLEVREAANTWEFVSKQLACLFEMLKKEDLMESIKHKLVIAYEPIWAIGTGKVATPDQAQEVHALIKGLIREQCPSELAAQARIIYGGSVNAKNCGTLIAQPDIDGFLVGGASLTSDFKTIIASVDSQ